jgi:hypothetical protein
MQRKVLSFEEPPGTIPALEKKRLIKLSNPIPSSLEKCKADRASALGDKAFLP